MNADRIAEWVYQLERIAPKVYAKQHMAVVEVIEFLKNSDRQRHGLSSGTCGWFAQERSAKEELAT